MIYIFANAGLFRDALAESLLAKSYSLGTVTDQYTELDLQKIDGCLVVHIATRKSKKYAHIGNIRKIRPDLPIVLVCRAEFVPEARNLIGSQVNAIITEDKSLALVRNVIKVAEEGFSLVDVRSNEDSCDERGPCSLATEQSDEQTEHNTLTEREATVLQKIGDGRSNKEIARMFDISESTVKAHTQSIFRKIGVRNRTQAAIWSQNVRS